MQVLSDQEAFEVIKPKSRPVYQKAWLKFKSFDESHNFENGMPGENLLSSYFKQLRASGAASSSLWTTYSLINAVIKAKYSERLQKYPRLTSLIKSFDTDIKKKAAIFEPEDMDSFINSSNNDPYWLVRKVIVILAYFGGLRGSELMNLQVENMSSTSEGVYVTHQRSKQRNDKKNTRFIVPRAGSYAGILEEYLHNIKSTLSKTTGRLLWTGRSDSFVNTPLGKNSIADVPHFMAGYLKKDDVKTFTFHSYRRSAATAAADTGATAAQLTDFFGWKSPSMTTEYVSTSKMAVNNMASLLVPEKSGENIKPPVETNEQDDEVDLDKDPTKLSHNKNVFIITNFSGTMNFN